MTVVYILVGVIVLLFLAAIYMNTYQHTRWTALVAKVEANPVVSDAVKIEQEVSARLTTLLNHSKATGATVSVSTVPGVYHSTTTTTITPAPVVAPPAAIPAAPVATVNGVPVPDGLTYAAFVHLVLAVQGVQGWLANRDMAGALAASSLAWWNALGPYFREELLMLTPEGSPLADTWRVMCNRSLTPHLSVAGTQQVAALAAVTAVAPVTPATP